MSNALNWSHLPRLVDETNREDLDPEFVRVPVMDLSNVMAVETARTRGCLFVGVREYAEGRIQLRNTWLDLY